ncbi:MAG: hypothetical protein ACXWLH_04980 [Candidatus Saccharimonadales bacterium]
MLDEKNNSLLIQKVTERSSDINFRHHKWFVDYHLKIVEKIAHGLCNSYRQANRQFVDALVWLHDYEKIVDFDNQYNTELVATRKLMQEVGYSATIIKEMTDAINQFNAKNNLALSQIEIQIVSSADAASHLVGPFMTLYWYENPSKSIQELQAENIKKIAIDWDQKVTLPEIKSAFAQRHQHALEVAGKLPQSYV